MPGTPTIKGNGTIIWGTGQVYATGTIISGRTLSTSDTKMIMDNAGFTQAKVYFNHRDETEFEALVETSVPSLTQGDAITVGGVANCLVDEVEVLWEQAGEAKWRVKATQYDALTLS